LAEKIITGNRCLLDTSALVSLIDKSDVAHGRVKQSFERTGQNFFSTIAVITEALHLLSRVKNATNICLDYVLTGVVELFPLEKPDLSRIKTLMAKYADIPMDFADATLVVVAEEMGIDTIMTLDRRGFEAYRMLGSKSFIILP